MKGIIKELENLDDFKSVYKVFSGEPYNEKYTDEELEDIFEEYKENGYLYGVYAEEKCAGLVALEEGVKEDHPVKFYKEEKVMYLADIAVLDKYRRTGLGTQLMIYAQMQSKVLGFQRLYMRTLEPERSMSYGIATKIGFKQIPNAYQSVERERTDGAISSAQNVFLDIDLETLNKDDIYQSIQDTRVESNIKESTITPNSGDSLEEDYLGG